MKITTKYYCVPVRSRRKSGKWRERISEHVWKLEPPGTSSEGANWPIILENIGQSLMKLDLL